MGKVYRALDRELGQHVALKLLAESAAVHATRFAEEARILAELDHPNIVRWIGHGEDAEGQRWLALEWLDGEDLAMRLAHGPLSVEDSLAIGIAAADALAAAHEHGVIHRDIKPSNLFLVGKDPRHTKLLDFGVARRNSATRVVTRSGVVVGTAGYIPPEHIRGEPTDARADVFSLGAVLFECLTGQPAFAGGSMAALLRRLLVDEPAPLRHVRHDVPPELDALIASMLAKEPSRRPVDAAAVADTLRNACQENFPRRTNDSAGDIAFGDGAQYALPVENADSPLGIEYETTVGGKARRSPSLFVGRDRELNTLLALFEECADEGVARAVLVTGQAGIGKSRLCDEALQRIGALLRETQVWTARGEVARGSSPRSLLGALVREKGIDEGEIAPAFLYLARAALEKGPLILVLDDFQWADASSIVAVDQALDEFRNRPLFVLALARPDAQSRFSRIWAERDALEMQLGGLAARAATRMVQHALGNGAEEAKIAALVDRAGGHPFYLEELIRAAIAGRGNALPAAVLAMVRARLAALTPEERRFLRAASIFGDVFWVRGVLHLLGGGSPTAARTLVDRNFLTRRPTSRWPGEDELSFREPLVCEAVFATVSAADRERGHALATAWLASIEATRASRTDEPRVTK